MQFAKPLRQSVVGIGFLLVLGGCGSGKMPLGKVEGKVSFRGEPLKFGTVVFQPQKGLSIMCGSSRADKAPETGKVRAQREGTRIRLTNGQLLVEIDASSGTWDASWPDGPSAAIRRARFSASVDGRTLPSMAKKAEVKPFADKLGAGLEVRQCWGSETGVEVRRILRVYDGEPTVTIAGCVVNHAEQDARLDTVCILDVSAEREGGWSLGPAAQAPGAVVYPPMGGNPPCLAASADTSRNHEYRGTGVLAFASPGSKTGGLAMGFVRSLEAAPSVEARFRPGVGGTSLRADGEFRGRVLKPKQQVELSTVWVSARKAPHDLLSSYGDAIVALADRPARRGGNSLWCSWYPIRLGISEEVVFENAAVAAKHFKPLGMDTIQLDHGWQRGNLCGDWVANERFPHGIKWLAEQLQSRYAMKLGLWIAPTVVTADTETFRDHADWLFKDAAGTPQSTSRWFWEPKPLVYALDGSHPEADRWVETTFARLSEAGARYYKIDFLTGGGGQQPHDPQCVPGWGVYRRVVEAIRRGAGEDAWIRYTQAPPLLVVGLADSSMISPDTGDAGLTATLAINAQLLAASYWANERLYHREVCDNSVGEKAGVEESRLRLAMMSLGGCSTSYSDDFRRLPPARIRMMQQCLPPGGPTMTPLDLFERAIPSHWHIHCKNKVDEWDVLGVFNFGDAPCRRNVDLTALGVSPKNPATVFEFWQSKPLGTCQDRLTLDMPPLSSRVLFIRRSIDRPQVVGTDMHVLGGYHEITRAKWDPRNLTLTGECRRAAGLSGKVFVNIPKRYRPRVAENRTSGKMVRVSGNVWALDVVFAKPDTQWSVQFEMGLPPCLISKSGHDG